jgi:hypothetical protein
MLKYVLVSSAPCSERLVRERELALNLMPSQVDAEDTLPFEVYSLEVLEYCG